MAHERIYIATEDKPVLIGSKDDPVPEGIKVAWHLWWWILTKPGYTGYPLSLRVPQSVIPRQRHVAVRLFGHWDLERASRKPTAIEAQGIHSAQSRDFEVSMKCKTASPILILFSTVWDWDVSQNCSNLTPEGFRVSPFSSKGIPWFRWAFRPRLQPRGQEMAHGDEVQQSFWWLHINQLPAGYVLSAMHHSDGAALWGSLSCTWISFSDSPRYQEVMSCGRNTSHFLVTIAFNIL